MTQVIRHNDQITEQETKRKAMENPLNRCDDRLPKLTPITNDYEISNHVLGLGINGKVVQCYDRKTREKYALKVSCVSDSDLNSMLRETILMLRGCSLFLFLLLLAYSTQILIRII